MLRIAYFFALDAEHMIVKIGAKVVSVRSRHSHMADQTVLTKKVQITVYGSVADFRIQLMHIIEYLIGCWVICPCLYRL